MNVFTKFGSFLGAVAFAVLAVVGYHQYTEVSYLNAHQPPTLIQLQDSVVTVRTSIGLCSGWIDSKTHKVYTGAHCFGFEAGDATVTFNNGEEHLYTVEKISTDETDTKGDHAVLIPKNAAETIKYPSGLPICQHKPYYGEPIVMMGNPLGVMQVMYFGYIANPGTEDGIVIDIHLMPGNSGGPVIDEDEGCVIGSAKMIRLFDPEIRVPLGVNYAAPVDNL